MSRTTTEETATDRFFHEVAEQESNPLVRTASGTIRFDLADNGHTKHWFVDLDHGAITVSHRQSSADAVVRVDKTTFDRMTQGEVNVMAAILRGEIEADGDLGLLMLFQRLFPSPPPGIHTIDLRDGATS